MSVSIKKEGGMQNRTVCNWLKTHREREIDKERRGEGEKTHWITSLKQMGCSNPPDCWDAFILLFAAKKREYVGWVGVWEREQGKFGMNE